MTFAFSSVFIYYRLQYSNSLQKNLFRKQYSKIYSIQNKIKENALTLSAPDPYTLIVERGEARLRNGTFALYEPHLFYFKKC